MDNNLSQNPFEQKELKLGEVKVEAPLDENLFKEEVTEKKKLNITKESIIKIVSFILLIITLILFVFFLYKVIQKSSKAYQLDKLKFTIENTYEVKKRDNILELKKGTDLVTISLIKEENMFSKMSESTNLKKYETDNHLTCSVKNLMTNYIECQKEGELIIILPKKESDNLLINIKGNPLLKEEVMKIAMNARYS